MEAKDNDGPGPQSGKQGQKSRLSNLEHLKQFFGLEILRNMFAFSANAVQSREFPPLNILESMITM